MSHKDATLGHIFGTSYNKSISVLRAISRVKPVMKWFNFLWLHSPKRGLHFQCPTRMPTRAKIDMELGRRRVIERTHWLGGYLGKGAISLVAMLLGNSKRSLRIFFLRCFCFCRTYRAACMLAALVHTLLAGLSPLLLFLSVGAK
jgi:hypothetical protein